MISVTALDMYNATLNFLNKYNNSSVDPDEWMIFANHLQIEHVLALYAVYQEDQSVIDKLSPLVVKPITIANSGVNAPGQEVFELPYMTIPGPTTENSYGYLRMLNISGRLNYVNNACHANGIGNLIPLFPLSDDQETIIDLNPYRRAKDDRVYYQVMNNKINVITGTQSWCAEVRVKYLRYPRALDLSASGGIGDCELPIDVRNDLVDLITKRIVENIESNRYPTFTKEIQSNINN